MSALFTIVYATHANGTHHKLALDALRHLDRPDAENWRRVFLKHVEVFLEGSKAPDNEFKDFKNHVLHVRDNYWGGAPEKVQSWYDHTVEALRDGDWARAAYAAGVLSHYYTDPIHPFHTQQSEAENNIHRAAEWSINRAYNGLRKDAEAQHSSLIVSAPAGEHWLKDHVCRGAEKSNAHYEKLIAHYDIHKGVVDPPAGLDAIARGLVSELMMYASKGFAVILDRAIDQSGAQAPEVSLTVETVLATLKVPLKWVTKKIDDAETRRLVEGMYDELTATGRVEQTLPEDDRMVRELHAKEVLAPRDAQLAAARVARLPAAPSIKKTSAATNPPAALSRPARATSQPSAQAATVMPIAHDVAAFAPKAAEVVQPKAALSSLSRPPRIYLAAIDDVEAAPSIGPKMAERLAAAGIKTVADFLAADPDATVAALGDRRITADTIDDWQDQARLVMTVPGLRGTHAQLLVGAGFRTADALAATDPSTLSSAVLDFATTDDGARVLRSGDTPDFEAIARWIDNARLALAA
jgi:predicted flap endonuclease-1-like 5' DNA nuclease